MLTPSSFSPSPIRNHSPAKRWPTIRFRGKEPIPRPSSRLSFRPQEDELTLNPLPQRASNISNPLPADPGVAPCSPQNALDRDLRILANSLLRIKAMELLEDNPDVPFEELSKNTLGTLSPEGLAHVAHHGLAKWMLEGRYLENTTWGKRPPIGLPSRFWVEYLERQENLEAEAFGLNELTKAFQQLNLQADSTPNEPEGPTDQPLRRNRPMP